jgi:hypothetical protein
MSVSVSCPLAFNLSNFLFPVSQSLSLPPTPCTPSPCVWICHTIICPSNPRCSRNPTRRHTNKYTYSSTHKQIHILVDTQTNTNTHTGFDAQTITTPIHPHGLAIYYYPN